MATAYDLLILIDSTASMGTYLKSLNRSLQDIARISSLTGRFDRIGVLTYGDYCGGPLTQWSGWFSEGPDSEITQQKLLDFALGLRPAHGGDWPEATKTGLAHAYQVMRSEATTIVLLFSDAPPHMPTTAGDNRLSEIRLLKTPGSYGGTAASFADWASAAHTLRHGDKRAKVFSMIESGAYALVGTLSLYAFLSEVTGGVCVQLNEHSTSQAISELTIGVLLAWMGVEKEGAKKTTYQVAKLAGFEDKSGIEQVVSETSEDAGKFFPVQKKSATGKPVKQNLTSTVLTMENLNEHIKDTEDKSADFSKRYATDAQYRDRVTKQMEGLIANDVKIIAVNPVFGNLWRAICNDRTNPMRDDLITKFGLEVSKLVGPEKDRMKAWLEESYDRLGEIVETISSVPDDKKFPCVFLDPTLGFNDEDKMTRDELMEIGRSCDARILRRLGRVLTRLTYVASEDNLPLHIKDMPLEKVPRIPMALATSDHGRVFWKILLHCVLSGTMLAGRPAALLAALSLRMGMKPLEKVAYQELLSWKNNWATLDIPETWNTNCLSLLLEADQKAQALGGPVLQNKDRELFKTLVEYKLLEFNLKTTLNAKIGWHPEKARMPIGPVVTCKSCRYPRSVTMMSAKGICGMCVPSGYPNETAAEKEAWITGHVSKDDNADTPATWVECSTQTCRAQYVVYFAEKLNVRAKCHYCRQVSIVAQTAPDYKARTVAPYVECTVCLSRVIWPHEYRPADFSASTYKCVGCASGKCTIINEETSPEKLLVENPSTAWLLRNVGDKIAAPFGGRSLFYVISTAGIDDFAQKVQVLPQIDTPDFRIKGKLVHNADEMIANLREWVVSRKVQQGTCSLCFSDMNKRLLRPACMRSGCKEQICESCMDSWYGLNARGKIINVAALSCPFCRRQPSTKVNIPNELKFLGGLKNAVEDAGSWIYGWCSTCGLAKKHVERVCAAGAPAEFTQWQCDDCVGFVQDIKVCPGCAAPSQKISGCDHVECPICGTHWCFFCGKAVAASKIYQHMSQAHAGWYGGEEFPDDVDDDW
ncbi:hypothetical protein OQA88_2657 [Cercophora sp. LCS_1]